MRYYHFYHQPADELHFFPRTYWGLLYEYENVKAFLIADETNPNNSPYVAIEHCDEVRGYECDVLYYDRQISYDILDNNVCIIRNLEEITNSVQPITRLIADCIRQRNEQPNQ